VRQRGPLRVECVVERIFEEVDERRSVDVGETIQTPSEVRWIVVGAEQTAEALVEQHLHHLSTVTHTSTYCTHTVET